ncbi:MAG TPA: MoxR family ATPase [Acidimicrobiia bacterium]|nr:MoxR family ATPase [Acidimicrobiia bacterium]
MNEVAATGARVVEAVSEAVIGKQTAVRLILAAALADGHVLIEDLPGLGKTLLVRSLGQATGLGHARIQFTPDLMPLDITGSTVLDPASRQAEFRPGPIFAHLLLADEINRAPAKTQAALLEAMQEGQVTVDGVTRTLERPFLVVATQNPIEYEGTYPLPEAQLDRFLIRVDLGYPQADDEWEMLRSRAERHADEVEVTRVVDRSEFLRMQAALEDVFVSEAVGRYIVALVDTTRRHRRVRVGASPRGSLALMKMARAMAALEGRGFVLPDDVQEVAQAALAHRLIMRPEAWAQGIDEKSVVGDCLTEVPVPSVAPEG